MILRLEHVQKTYGNFKLDCSLKVEEGCVTGLIGANGAGKSTVFKTILGLVKPDGGAIQIFGKELPRCKPKDKEEIGVVLADSTFSGVLDIRDVAAIMKAMYQKFGQKRFLEKCQAYQLPLEKPLKDFSTGMKAKFKLLLAMSYDARLLILDEPTVGLDSVTRGELLDEMRGYMEQEGKAILISSHISSDLEGLCDDLYVIQDGDILLHEDTDVILSDYAVLKASEEQYQNLDKSHVIYQARRPFGYELLTTQRQFYQENYPGIIIERGNIDDLMFMVSKGERI